MTLEHPNPEPGNHEPNAIKGSELDHNLDKPGDVIARAEALIKQSALRNRPTFSPLDKPRLVDQLAHVKQTIIDPFQELVRRLRG